ncbi:MAG: hypothetical protein GX616_09695, partial [Planctomycetes bacterium]|nr:hypothetical protein [Planctomycetota bacterium]
MTRQALSKVAVCTALLAALAVTGITQAQDPPPAAFGSPYLNGLVVDNPESVTDPLAQRMFNGRGGWLVVPVYEWVNFSDGHYDAAELQYHLRPRVEAAARAGYSVILRLYWKHQDAAGPAAAPSGQWCIPPEDQQGFKQQYADWCKLVAEKLGGGDQSLPAMSTHFVIGNEPNQECEHGGSGCFRASWYADVFRACQTSILEAAPNSKVLVAGVTPGTTGCQQDDDWLIYVNEIASNLGEEADHYAIHGQVDACVTAGPDGPLPSQGQAYDSGPFIDYYYAINLARGSGQNLYCYIVEVNPFFGDFTPAQHYGESWLIHTFDAVAYWNDILVAIHSLRPFQCVCYFSYDLPDQPWQDDYNLRAPGSTTEPNTNHSLHVAAEKDFPLLIHRNDAPRPRINLLEGGQTQVFPDSSMDGHCAVDGDGWTSGIFSTHDYTGFPGGSITCNTFNNGLWPVNRMMAWARVDYSPHAIQGNDPKDIESEGVTAELFATAAHNPIAPLKQCYHDTLMDGMVLAGDFGGTYCQSVCAGLTDPDAGWGGCYDEDHYWPLYGNYGWYEICAYPPPDRVASGQLGPSRSVTFTVEPSVTVLSPTSAMISWQTNVPSTSRVDYGTASTYGSHVYLCDQTHTPVIGITHSVTLTGLTPNTTYHYVATSTATGRTPTPMSDRTFTTTTTVPPITISGIYVDNITLTSAVVHWTTNVASNSRVDYGTTTSYGAMRYNGSLVTSHAITLTGLS